MALESDCGPAATLLAAGVSAGRERGRARLVEEIYINEKQQKIKRGL